MKITHEDYDQLSVVTLRGDLAAELADELRKLALDRMSHNVRDFVLDTSGMEFVDSQGLEALLWLQDQASEKLGQVRIAALSENVRKILEITRLATRFDCHPDVDSAVKSLR